jgi:hypothetical protein
MTKISQMHSPFYHQNLFIAYIIYGGWWRRDSSFLFHTRDSRFSFNKVWNSSKLVRVQQRHLMFDTSYVYGNNTATSHFKINFANSLYILSCFHCKMNWKPLRKQTYILFYTRYTFILILSDYPHDLFLG